jgi:hypothetical protein
MNIAPPNGITVVNIAIVLIVIGADGRGNYGGAGYVCTGGAQLHLASGQFFALCQTLGTS